MKISTVKKEKIKVVVSDTEEFVIAFNNGYRNISRFKGKYEIINSTEDVLLFNIKIKEQFVTDKMYFVELSDENVDMITLNRVVYLKKITKPFDNIITQQRYSALNRILTTRMLTEFDEENYKFLSNIVNKSIINVLPNKYNIQEIVLNGVHIALIESIRYVPELIGTLARYSSKRNIEIFGTYKTDIGSSKIYCKLKSPSGSLRKMEHSYDGSEYHGVLTIDLVKDDFEIVSTKEI